MTEKCVAIAERCGAGRDTQREASNPQGLARRARAQPVPMRKKPAGMPIRGANDETAGTRAYCGAGAGGVTPEARHKLYEFVKGPHAGHMKVLLSEAGVPYDIVSGMEDINGEFEEADVAIVIGANDTVSPAARTNKSSPIHGEPIRGAEVPGD